MRGNPRRSIRIEIGFDRGGQAIERSDCENGDRGRWRAGFALPKAADTSDGAFIAHQLLQSCKPIAVCFRRDQRDKKGKMRAQILAGY